MNLFIIQQNMFLLFLETGDGDVTYNSRRGILGTIPCTRKMGFHLFSVGYSGQKGNYSVKLLKKSKWHSQCHTEGGD